MMLLFLLTFNFIHGFSDCGKIDAAQFNESILLDKHYQNLLQVNTVLEDVQKKIHNMSVLTQVDDKHGRRQDKEVNFDNVRDLWSAEDHNDENAKSNKRKPAKFHPFAQYNPLPTISDRRQGSTRWFPRFSSGLNVPQRPFFIRQPSSEYRMAIVPFNPGHRLGPPGYLLRPMRPRLNPPRFLSNYLNQNVYLRPPAPYLPRPLFAPRPALETFNQPSFDTEVNSILQEFPQLFNPPRPTLSRPVLNLAESGTSQLVTLSSSIRPATGKGVNIWLQGPYGVYIPVIDKWRNVATDQPPSLSSKRTLVPPTPHSSATTTVSTTNRTPKMNDHQDVTGAADAAQLFTQDEHGLPYLNLLEKGGTPVPIPHYSKNLESTTAGDVFYGKIKVRDPPPQQPTQRYRALMERLDEGYMLVFMIELCRLIAVKDQKEVRQALHHTETIYNHLWNNGRLAWIDDPLQTVIWKLSVMTSEGDIDVVRTYASMMFHMLLRRRQTLSAEVNSFLDDADLFYNDAEGEQLFNALKEFENYPNTTKSSYWLCDSLIESFLRPFRRPRQHHSRRRQELLDAINAALKTRFPLLLKQHGAANHTNGQPRKRKRKRHHFPYKVMRKRKRQSTPEYHNENMDYENSILRSMTTMTSEQAKFRAIPSNKYRIKKRLRTTVNLLNRPTRAYSFNKRNRKLSSQIQATTPFQEKIDDYSRNNDESTKKTDIHHHRFDHKSTAGYTPPTRDVSMNGSFFLAFSSPSPLKRARKDKSHVYQIKEKLKKSETKKKDTIREVRAGLLRKISVFPTMLRAASSVSGRS